MEQAFGHNFSHFKTNNTSTEMFTCPLRHQNIVEVTKWAFVDKRPS